MLERILLLLPTPLISKLVLIGLFLPLFIIIFFGFTTKSHRLGGLATGLISLSFLTSGYTLLATYQGISLNSSYVWFSLLTENTIQVFSLGMHIDFIAALMLCMISFLSCWVYFYSIPYLQQKDQQRYFVLLSLFVSAMLWLVIANNLLGVFIGWEVMSWASYLLIGFWYQQTQAIQASTKAWLISKLGSVFFLMGLLLIGKELGSFSLPIKATITPAATSPWLVAAGLCFLVGVFTKSAQFPFFNWLPWAMTAPTPVSALLHAATLVSAGIYLLIRIHPILTSTLLNILVAIGSITAFMGAYAALAQQDIKRMLAYSTLSQLGYMVMAIGIQAPSAGLLHLVAHAFLKACLFLCAGAIAFFLKQHQLTDRVIYDMSCMGGLISRMPGVCGAYLVASLSLIGIPGFIGFVSKETILAHSLAWAMSQAPTSYYLSYLVPSLAFASSLLTVYYIGNSWVVIFRGTPHWQALSRASKKQVNNPWIPFAMQLSILVLALCSFNLSYIAAPFNPKILLQHLEFILLGTTKSYTLSQPIQEMSISLWIALTLIGLLSLIPSNRPLMTRLLKNVPKMANISLHGWYIDWVTGLVSKQVKSLSQLVVSIDQKFIQAPIRHLAMGYVLLAHIMAWIDFHLIGGIIKVIGLVLQGLSNSYQYLQTGNLQHYFWWTYLGIALALAWYIYKFSCFP